MLGTCLFREMDACAIFKSAKLESGSILRCQMSLVVELLLSEQEARKAGKPRQIAIWPRPAQIGIAIGNRSRVWNAVHCLTNHRDKDRRNGPPSLHEYLDPLARTRVQPRQVAQQGVAKSALRG